MIYRYFFLRGIETCGYEAQYTCRLWACDPHWTNQDKNRRRDTHRPSPGPNTSRFDKRRHHSFYPRNSLPRPANTANCNKNCYQSTTASLCSYSYRRTERWLAASAGNTPAICSAVYWTRFLLLASAERRRSSPCLTLSAQTKLLCRNIFISQGNLFS